jgi:hypothetical protein
MLRWPAGQRRVNGVVLDAAGGAATLAAVILGSHSGRGEFVQIIFAATMMISAMGETLLSSTLPVTSDDRAPSGAARRFKRLGTLAFVTGCMLGPSAGGAALGAGWGTSLLATLAVGCALASVAVHRLGRQLAPGAVWSHEPHCPSAVHTARMAPTSLPATLNRAGACCATA